MDYLTITQDDRDKAIAEAIHSREMEYFHCELNASNYTGLLAGMDKVPDTLPVDLAYLQGRSRDEIIVAAKSDNDRDTAIAVMDKLRLRRLLAAEQYERSKTEAYYGQLLAQLPDPAKRAAALAAAKADRDAANAARNARQ